MDGITQFYDNHFKSLIMNRFLFLLVFLFPFSLFSQDLYSLYSIKTLDIHFYNINWDKLLDSLKQAGSDSCILARITYDSTVFDQVGIRFKGNSSYNPNSKKNPFHIELDYIQNQSINGYKTLKLSNMFKDPTFVREVLGYQIAGNYLPSPLSNFINVSIDGEYIGLYTNTESINKTFVQKHFGSKENSFFKCDPVSISGKPQPPPAGCPVVPGISSSLNYLNDDTSCYTVFYEIKSDYGWTKLLNLIKSLNLNLETLPQYLNIDRTLWMLAFNNIFVNLDSYNGSGHNYYLCEDNYGRFQPVLWDLNECFGVFRNTGITMLNNSQMQTLAPDLNVMNNNRPLLQKLLKNTEYRKKYFAHYRTIFNEFVQNDSFLTMAQSLQSLIDNEVKYDPNKKYSYLDFQNSLNQNIGSGQGEIIGLNVLMSVRKNFLANHPDITIPQPIIQTVKQFDSKQPFGKAIPVTAVISDANKVWLYYRNRSFAPFQAIQMYDDGQHYDNQAGDNIFGAAIPAQDAGVTVHYYIYAENNEAGSFSPARAENQYYLVKITGNSAISDKVVINEIMASNTKTVQDENGEYDDWIELYNNANTDISLKGFYLSDNSSNPFKWIFPDTFIRANSFLILWADEDETQPGLHVNFKLSKSGEEVLLYDSSKQLVDSLNFGAQQDDISLGRYPNGTGNFIPMPPTFNQQNIEFGYIAEHNDNKILIFPNPACQVITVECLPEFLPDKIEIFNTMGKKIKETETHKATKIQINVSEFENGLYLLKMGNKTSRFFVIH